MKSIVCTTLVDKIYMIYTCVGPCHTYVQQRGRTGGWMDAWCIHDFKIGAKMESIQESVSDISDIIHSMKKFPVLHILDDPCHFVR